MASRRPPLPRFHSALATLMGTERGIPQGSDTSSALATAFLCNVDHRPKIKKLWRLSRRRKTWNKCLIKYLINRLRKSKDDLAVNWCLERLGVLDWLAESVART